MINETCPTDGTAYCLSHTQEKVSTFYSVTSAFNRLYAFQISLYLSPYRNCKGGHGPRCTKEQPCYPCQLSKVIVSLIIKHFSSKFEIAHICSFK
jgi:hypothetical protein